MITLAGLCLAFVNTCFAEKPREWVNNEGKSILAKFVKVNDKGVVLLKDGKTYTIKIDTLSAEDQKYIKAKLSESASDDDGESSDGIVLKISKRGKLVYETAFKNNEGWRVSSGIWECEDGAVTATQQPGKKHKGHMVIKKPKPVNVIVECEIYLGEAAAMAFTIDDAPPKLGQIVISPKGFRGLQTHRKQKVTPIKKTFNSVKKSIARDKWYKVCIEMVGNQIVAQIDGEYTESIDENWAGKPKRLGLHLTNGPGKFRNFKMWEALPLE